MEFDRRHSSVHGTRAAGPVARPANQMTGRDKSCLVCKKEGHFVAQCPSLKPEDRRKTFRELRAEGKLADGHREMQHPHRAVVGGIALRSEEHTSELQSLLRISFDVFCL